MTALSRRAFLLLAGMLAMPPWARGQTARRVHRLGWLSATDSC